jgi:phosphopantothenoylcysteine decarboxylase / phosphopantothenate---cysteine ligase
MEGPGDERQNRSVAGLPLKDRFVVLGVTGGIAAYKAVDVCRRLMDLGAHVAPVMTEDATRFVGPLTFSALASEPCRTGLFDQADTIPHTRLGQQAEVVVVAPATARFISAYATGLSDGLLTATVIATRAPVVVCPAMHTEMWEHPAVQENVATLVRRGVHIVWPEEGRLAGGDEGKGRLADPADIVARVSDVLRGPGVPSGVRDLEGLRVLVTAGGTREPIDPVRFITNRSSGKQGHALAEAAADRGAVVSLVTAAGLPARGVHEVTKVETAAEMERAVLDRSDTADVVVMAAAVADFRPKVAAAHKLHKQDGVPDLVLEPTTDILAVLGRRRRKGQVLVGFAAETGATLERASEKMSAKGVDVMVSNDVTVPGAGFDHDTNSVTILVARGGPRVAVEGAKSTVAHAVLDTVAKVRAATGVGDPVTEAPDPRREQ